MGKSYCKQIFHVCITVEDIDKALDFYCGVLGMHSTGALRGEKSDGALLGFPGQTIEINANHLEGSAKLESPTVIDLIEYITPKTYVGDGPVKDMNKVGLTRMAFGVEDLLGVYGELKQRDDVKFVCEPVLLNAPTGGYLMAVSFYDPFGNFLEFLEHLDEKPEGWEVA